MSLTSDLLTLSEAAKRCPIPHNGRTKPRPGSTSRPDTMRLWRWCRKGILSRAGQRVRLKHYRVGGRLYTTEADLAAFFFAVAEADAEHFNVAATAGQLVPEPVRAARPRDQEIAAAQADPRRDGF